jgi:ribonuclease G
MTPRRERQRLLIAARPGERRIAWVAGPRLLEFRILRDDRPPLVGRICRGRIARVDRGLDAAFVDYGAAAAGFLPLRECPTPPVEGQALIVQVTREPFDGKAARLTARPVLRAQHLSWSPLGKGPALPRDRGEADRLRGLWADIERKAAEPGKPGALLPAPDPLAELLRDHGTEIEEIGVDSRAGAARIAELCRSVADDAAAKAIYRPQREWNPSAEALEEQIDAALAEEAILPSGATLHFGTTKALTAIDVDSAGARLEGVGAKAERSFLKIDLEAAREIACQIRLRNLGGILVADFIDLRARELRQRVADELRAAAAGDPQPVWVGGMSRLGLVEMTRPRSGPSLADLLLEDCGACGGRHRRPREELRPWLAAAL